MVGPEEVDSSTELPHARIVIVRTARITKLNILCIVCFTLLSVTIYGYIQF